MSSIRTVRRYVHSLRHLRAWQVVGRVVAPLRRRWAVRRVPEPPTSLGATGAARVDFPAHEPWNAREDVLLGRFCFLNETAELGRPVDWQARDMPLLWRFNLHYFHYLHGLAPDEQVALCRAWGAANPPGTGVGWHPYPTALRIVNWCRVGLTAPDLLASLYRQAAYLHRNLETHVGGNHLLENARALVLAGWYLQGQGEADAWLRRGLAIYRQETGEQVLTDGFHYERSPMYHALMLEGYLDVLNVLPADHPDRPWLAKAARAMAAAFAGVVQPDGTLALFNDSTHEIALPPDRLLAYAERVLGEAPRPRTLLPEAGYFVHRGDAVWLMIDAGPGGPDHLMAHAHADALSYELALRGRRFVVDAGVYEYPAGPMRRYVRSTAAHNTVEVDGSDQIECWDSFRVARRSAPHDVAWRATERGAKFEGTFSGYADRIGDGIRHVRRLTIDEAAQTVTVEDEVRGRGRHRVASRIHLHPDVEVREEGGGAWRLDRNGVACTLAVDAPTVRRETGWYCPRFGVRTKNTVLVLQSSGALPTLIRYTFHY